MKLSVIKNSLFSDSPYSSSPPRRPHRNPLGLRTALCAMLALLPCTAQAIQIGEVETASKLGEPLRVEVAITSAQNEPFDSSCISLVTPDANAEDANHYLTSGDVKLSIPNDGKPRILLSSHKPFNEVFAKFKLQVKCQGQGSIAKTYTVLPDINNYATQPESSTPVAEPATTLASHAVPENLPIISAPPTGLATATAANVIIDKPTPQPIKRPRQVRQVANSTRPIRRTRTPGVFQLKISGDPLDASRIGKISEEERTLLLAQQRLLDSDDQMASILALQNQVKQLQDDIGDLRAKFAQLDGVPAHINQSSEITANETVAAEAASAPVKVTAAQPAVTSKPASPPNSDWRNWAWQLGLLIMGIAGVAWGLSRYSSKKSARTPAQQLPEINQARPAQTAESAPIAQSASPGETTVKIKAMAQAAVAAKVAIQTASSPETASPPASNERSEVDAIIEEAQLYAAFNHPLRAVKILQELLVEHPKKSEAWLLMLSIFSSLNRANEFENNARAFLRYNPTDNETWKTIQVLGRTLNPDHPLYKDNSPALSPNTVLGNRHLLGDVLIDLEMISPESLHHCLAHFDPKQHGRFGVYLVTEKVISHQQLTQALVHQNILNQGVPYTPPVDLKFELLEKDWRG